VRVRTDARRAEPALLALHRGLHRLAGDYGPRSVDLPLAPTLDPHEYAEAFGAKVRFRRSEALLRLPAGVLSGPAGHPPGDRSDLAWRVRHTLSERLGRRSTALADVARTIAVHPRTVQRGLADEGLTFGEILDCVRREQARAYLTGTDLPLTEISDRLGFAEPAVLSRCSRRWWGVTPHRFRCSSADSVFAFLNQ
jgi:AraC-like DNA-binding protein